jgi:hypothetical protein
MHSSLQIPVTMPDNRYSTSKAEEAGESSRSSRASLSDQAPSYASHTADDLYSDGIPNYQTGLPSLEEPVDETVEHSTTPVSQGHGSISPPIPELTALGPLSLTLDKDLIFPNKVPATALYSLNYTLNTMGTSITLRRSVTGVVLSNGSAEKIVDKDLYSITRPPMTDVQFELKGKRKSTYPGTGDLQLKKGFTGKYWECRFKEKVVLKVKNGKWTDRKGKPLATEVNEVVPKKVSKKGKEIAIDDGVRENPGLVFEEKEVDIDALLLDLIVAVWCAKTWWAETLEVRIASRGINLSEGKSRGAILGF